MKWLRRNPPVEGRERRRRDEASNSFAVFIVMAPVIFGAFGMGLDLSRNTYIRTSLQNDLDMATVGGAAVTTVSSNGAVVINRPAAVSTLERLYAINRTHGPTLDCIGDAAPIPGTTLKRCWQTLNYGLVTTNQDLTYNVVERSRNAFLPVIGLTYQTYHLTSKARVNQDTQ